MKLESAADLIPSAVTVTERGPGAASGEIVMLTERPGEVPPLPIVAVTPEQVNVTVVAPARFAPVTVAGAVVP